MNRPGFKMPVGSNCALMLRIRGSASPALPHTSIFDFTSGGQLRIESEPPRPSKLVRKACNTSARMSVWAVSSLKSPTPTACAINCHVVCFCTDTEMSCSTNGCKSVGRSVNLDTAAGELPPQSVSGVFHTLPGESTRVVPEAICNSCSHWQSQPAQVPSKRTSISQDVECPTRTCTPVGTNFDACIASIN